MGIFGHIICNKFAPNYLGSWRSAVILISLAEGAAASLSTTVDTITPLSERRVNQRRFTPWFDSVHEKVGVFQNKRLLSSLEEQFDSL